MSVRATMISATVISAAPAVAAMMASGLPLECPLGMRRASRRMSSDDLPDSCCGPPTHQLHEGIDQAVEQSVEWPKHLMDEVKWQRNGIGHTAGIPCRRRLRQYLAQNEDQTLSWLWWRQKFPALLPR